MEEKLRQYKMNVHAFHPFTSGIEQLMIFSEYERRFDDMLDFYRRYFEIMQRFGAKIFVFHGDHKTSLCTASFYAERYFRLREAAFVMGVSSRENIITM
jgi:sugar phosphate isomerase/epimerase